MVSETQSRRRINIKQTSKGHLYFDATVELENKTNLEVVREMQELISMIKKHIPVVDVVVQ